MTKFKLMTQPAGLQSGLQSGVQTMYNWS